ncbi:MarR family winged helix-turn-helix transcriptional regulator [Staphylococcus americanisciuri]|uniref:HTH-type transcriptional regulator SarZ n=1 Tax=Staphylococcus americanisciuri TaxID=2973940 RepID=A0ABT2F3S7_9STAP|nr:MarR family transcriptional regulator [Staphylococcus americanisciuri]MCS4487086.1 MarR family transcriptional regulator [Staphylococcus americanisciuri]
MHLNNDHRNLNQQLCFLFYVSSKEVIKSYTAHLKDYDLTYTGYITLSAFGDDEVLNIKQLGTRIYLNSGTLTPLIKKLVTKGLITKSRDDEDERNLKLSLTPAGKALKHKVQNISCYVGQEMTIDKEDVDTLVNILDRFVRRNFPYRTTISHDNQK